MAFLAIPKSGYIDNQRVIISQDLLQTGINLRRLCALTNLYLPKLYTEKEMCWFGKKIIPLSIFDGR